MSTVHGSITEVRERLVRGWAWIEGSQRPARVALFVNGKKRLLVNANERRPGVRRDSPVPTPNCGFTLRLSADTQFHDGDLISVRTMDPMVELAPGAVRFLQGALDEDGTLDLTVALVSEAPAEPDGATVAGSPAVAAAPPVNVELLASRPTADEIAEMVAMAPRAPQAPRRSGLRTYLDTLYALLLREIRNRYGRSRAGYAWAIVQPVLYMLLFSSLRTAVNGSRSDVYGVNGMYYFWLGLIPFFMFLHGFNQGMGATRAYKGLYQFRQVQPIDVIVVRVLVEYLTMSIVFAVLVFGFVWFGFSISAENWLGFLSVIGNLLILTIGCALLAEVSIINFPDSRQIIHLAERPLVLLSGTFFTIHQLSPTMREWLLWNPLLHATDLARGTMLLHYEAMGSWIYLTGTSLAFLMAGLAVYRRYAFRMVTQ